MKAIIMAGGLGTRISSLRDDLPKPMIPICGKPILEYQIACLKKNKISDFIIVVGYKSQIIMDYFNDGSFYNCSISYFIEEQPLGTAGALFKIKDLPDVFILTNGDLIFNIDFSKMISFHFENKALATLAVHPNNHPFDSSIIETDKSNKVTGWLNKEDKKNYYKNQVNSGIHILTSELLKICKLTNSKIDLDRDVLKPSIKTERIYSYRTPEYIKDIGTPERYNQVISDINSNFVQMKNLSVKQKCVFLDRDGTINHSNGFIKTLDDFILIDGVAESIKKLNENNFLVIIITNQPVIARGEITIETLDLIHMKLETELGKKGAYIDDIFYCPHHPDKGFPGELPELKIDCVCRKPKPGMILNAANKYNIDLFKSYMVGDDIRDAKAGFSAGCIPVLLTSNCEDIKTLKKEYEQMNSILFFNTLSSFVHSII